MEERCPLCGHLMQEDNFTHKLTCTFCGNEAQDDVAIPEGADAATICAIARELFLEGQYNKARTVLNKLDKLGGNRPDALLMKILCGYKVKDTEELLSKVESRSFEVQRLAENRELNTLANKLMLDHNLYVVHVLEYCSLGLRQSGEDMGLFYDRLKSGAAKKKPLSTIAKLDAEEIHNEERVRKLEDANKPEEASIPDMFMDYMNTAPLPSMYDNRPCSGTADNLAENILMDVIDMLTYDRGESFYNPEFMSRTRKFNAMKKEQAASETEEINAEVVPYDGITEDHELTSEEIDVRRNNILQLIKEEEKQIVGRL